MTISVKAACADNPGNALLRVFCPEGQAAVAPRWLDAAGSRRRASRRIGTRWSNGSEYAIADRRGGRCGCAAIRDVARERTLDLLPTLAGDTESARSSRELHRWHLILRAQVLVDLRGADLAGVALPENTLLNEVALPGTNLTNATLRGAGLGGADLGGAILEAADLAWANLSGANLSRGQPSRGRPSRRQSGPDRSAGGRPGRGRLARRLPARGRFCARRTCAGPTCGALSLTGAFVEAARLMGVRSLEGATLPNGTGYTGPTPPTNAADLGLRDPDNPDYLARAPLPKD